MIEGFDKNGKKLSKPSPLKMGFWKKAKKWAFGDNSERDAAAEALKKSQKALDGMVDDLKNIDTSNPYANAENAFAGLDNKMADLDNVYEGAENVYEGKMENKFEGQKNAYAGMKNKF